MQELQRIDNELIKRVEANEIDVFTEKSLRESLVESVKLKVKEFDPGDTATDKGRKEIAANAYLVTRTKTFIDNKRKKIVAELKDIPRQIDAGGKIIREELERIASEVREPLTQWEEAEKKKKDLADKLLEHLDKMASLFVRGGIPQQNSSFIKELLDDFPEYPFIEALGNFYDSVVERNKEVKELIEESLKSRLEYEAQQAEIEKLKKEAEEREEKDRLEREALEMNLRLEQDLKDRIAREKQEERDAIEKEKARIEREEKRKVEEENRKLREELEKKEREVKALAEEERMKAKQEQDKIRAEQLNRDRQKEIEADFEKIVLEVASLSKIDPETVKVVIVAYLELIEGAK